MSFVTVHISAAPNPDNSALLEKIAVTCLHDYDLSIHRVHSPPVPGERSDILETIKLTVSAATTLWQIYQYIRSLRPTATVTIRHGDNVIIHTERDAEAIRLLKLQIERGLPGHITIEIKG